MNRTKLVLGAVILVLLCWQVAPANAKIDHILTFRL